MSLVTSVPPGDGMPIGTILTFAFSAAPTGWMLCDGSLVPADTPLGEALLADGHPYGWDGTNPRIPNIQGRTIVGDNNHGSWSIGGTGGVEQVTLTTNQMPSHDHAVILNDGGHQHSAISTAGSGPNSNASWTVGGASAGGASTFGWTGNNGANVRVLTDNKWDYSRNTGGGQAHDNMPPYIVLNHIIKVGA